MLSMRVALLAVIVVTGCYSEMNSSSRQFLSPHASGVTTVHDVGRTAAEVARLLDLRGFAVVDEHPGAVDGQLVLELHGERDRDGTDRVGSELLVWITPAPHDLTHVAI